jgi:hypothetical protein
MKLAVERHDNLDKAQQVADVTGGKVLALDHQTFHVVWLLLPDNTPVANPEVCYWIIDLDPEKRADVPPGVPSSGALMVWWIPQVPMNPPFLAPVQSLEEAARTIHLLAIYDMYQFEYKVKPDYANAGGLLMWDGDEWVDWHSDDGFTDWNEWYEEYLLGMPDTPMPGEATLTNSPVA